MIYQYKHSLCYIDDSMYWATIGPGDSFESQKKNSFD